MNVYLAEFIGTAMVTTFGGGVVANVVLTKSKAKDAGWMVITTGWALGIAVAVYTVGWVSGAHLNPAVTIALATIGALDLQFVPGYIIAQLLGAMFGSLLMFLAYKKHFDEETDSGALLAIFCTGPAIRDYLWNTVTEVIATAIFIFSILGLGNSHNTLVEFTLSNGDKATGSIGILGALLVGFLVWAMGLCFGGPTGYALNPARDLGPRIMHALLPIKHKGGSDWGYSLVPIVGPILGGVIGALVYQALFS